MRFSPDGMHLLAGTCSGAGGVYLDGTYTVMPYGTAGFWGYTGSKDVSGPGGYTAAMRRALRTRYGRDGERLWQLLTRGTPARLPRPARDMIADVRKTLADRPGLYYCTPPGAPVWFSDQLASRFYGNGAGAWLLFLADGHTGCQDSAGHSWPSRWALDFLGDYQIFTDDSNIPIIFRNSHTGGEQTVWTPGEWTALPDGSTYFSKTFRGAFHVGQFYGCGYQAAYGGLCVWEPFNPTAPTWLLSRAPTDFNPDIAHRSLDGLLAVGSGLNQGETGQTLYVLDLPNRRMRINDGAWTALTPATPPTPEPLPPVYIAPFAHAQWVGPFFATGQYGNVDHPGSTEVLIRAKYQDMAGRPRPVFAGFEDAKTVPEGQLLGVYMSADEGGAEDANIHDAIDYAENVRHVPALIYVDRDDYPQSICDRWLNDASGTPIPNRIPVVRGYPMSKKMGEPLKATPAEDVARIRATIAHLSGIYARVAIAHTYYTQADGTHDNYPLAHILEMQEGLGDIERDFQMFASLGFSRLRTGGGDMSKYPELLDAFGQEADAPASTPSPILLPPDVVPPEPEPPKPEPPEPVPPEPEPPQPEPEPPQPEEPTMEIGDTIMVRRQDPGPSEQPLKDEHGTALMAPSTGLPCRPDRIKAVIVKHQDEDYLKVNDQTPYQKIYGISLNFPSGQGQIAHFNKYGEIDGVRDSAGADERVTFDGSKCMVARPGCGKDGRGVSVLYDMVKL